MDTLHEEASQPPTPFSAESTNKFFQRTPRSSPRRGSLTLLSPLDSDHHDSLPSSRRQSDILAALRRPSQAIVLSAAQAIMNQRRIGFGMFGGHSERCLTQEAREEFLAKEKQIKEHSRKRGNDALTIILSALYAKLLVVLGIAFPITDIISTEVTFFLYQGFYLYLYLGSIIFLVLIYTALAKEKALFTILKYYNKNSKSEGNRRQATSNDKHKNETNVTRYGSFYLRLGAVAFGIGSMVCSGLEFGRYFELRNHESCYSNILQAIIPATRMVLTLLQIQFIFLNSKDVDISRHKIIARFGLMHLIGTNLCEWLYVLVEETKHEIIHLQAHHNASLQLVHENFCQEKLIMGSLVTNASPFLFPCTIEYSLICAVILYEMWKRINAHEIEKETEQEDNRNRNKEERSVSQFNFSQLGGSPLNSNQHFTVDCSNAHKGLFAGIMVIVLTIISMIMFFVLANERGSSDKDKLKNTALAEVEVHCFELALYIITTIAIIIAMIQMRELKYERKIKAGGQAGIGLDNTLLVVAQTGMFIYNTFSIIGCYYTKAPSYPVGLLAETFSFVQTSLQTMFVLDSWWRRCQNMEQKRRKPGREIITFLIVANMAMWTINTLEKNRAEFRPTHLEFFGYWAWTVITHISMPLAIFYRFHSTICLFEIWKSTYKIKSQFKGHLLQYL